MYSYAKIKLQIHIIYDTFSYIYTNDGRVSTILLGK